MKIPKLSNKEAIILELLISKGAMYGLQMVNTTLNLKKGTIYTTLNRMREKGYIESKFIPDRRRFQLRRGFTATQLGKRVFHVWRLAGNLFAGDLSEGDLSEAEALGAVHRRDGSSSWLT